MGAGVEQIAEVELAYRLYEQVVEQGMGRNGTQALFLALERMNEEGGHV